LAYNSNKIELLANLLALEFVYIYTKQIITYVQVHFIIHKTLQTISREDYRGSPL